MGGTQSVGGFEEDSGGFPGWARTFAEEEAAEYIADHVTKPVVAYVAGRTAPPGKRMGHAGAIIQEGRGTAESKVKAFGAAGVPVAEYPVDVAKLLADT